MAAVADTAKNSRQFPGVRDVPLDLFAQGGQGGELLFVAQLLEEGQFHFLPVNIPRKIEQVRFHLDRAARWRAARPLSRFHLITGATEV